MEKLIFEGTDSKETIISAENIPEIYEKLIKGFPDYWKQGNSGCLFSLYEDEVIMKRLGVGFYDELGLCLTYEEFYDKEVGTVTGKKTICRMSDPLLAVYDETKLDRVVDIDCELYVSEGLLLPPGLAWKGIEEFIKTGEKSSGLKWIDPDELPEEGNWC